MMRDRLFLIIGLLCSFQFIFANNNWTDSTVGVGAAYNISWFNDSDSEYTIDTPAKLGGLAYKANTDREYFVGKTIKITKDLNMSQYNWVSISDFAGVFDGNGHTISGLKSDNTSVGLFERITDGEVRNVILSGTSQSSQGAHIGGVAAVLEGGIIENVAFIGTVSSSALSSLAGGIVGENKDGVISNSYFHGTASISNNNIHFGNIAGSSSGSISDCYYLENMDFPFGIAGETESDGIESKEASAFLSGEVTWLLNQKEGDYTGIWGQGSSYPVFANNVNKPAYKISYPETTDGTITGPSYAVEGATVALEIIAYGYENLTVSDAEIIDETHFIMPGKDIYVSCDFLPYPNDEIYALPVLKEEITPNTFIARWNEIENAQEYIITVKEGETVLASYNSRYVDKETTSLKVKRLSPATAYTYTVQFVTNNGEISTRSNEIEVTTAALPSAATNWTDALANNKFAYSLDWYDEESEIFTITTNAQLGGLARIVNMDEEYFAGKVINLGANVDMKQYYWISIENFKGEFNGNGYTISNLKTNKEGSGLFTKIDGGTVKNVVVTGLNAAGALESIGGGIAGTLKEGIVENCAYVGKLVSDAQNAVLGGIVGVNDKGIIKNCHFYFNSNMLGSIEDGTLYGNIAGRSTGTITNCYFLADELLNNGIGEGEGEASSKDASSFASGEVAWLLNQDNNIHTALWGQGESYPVHATENNKSIYAISYGGEYVLSVDGPLYAPVDAEVTFEVTVEDFCTLGSTTSQEVEIEDYTFIMPEQDVTVNITTVLNEIEASPAEQVTHNSFVAVWNSVKDATYAITVKQGATIVRPYNQYQTGTTTSYKVEGLSAGVTYTYIIHVVKDGEIVDSSEEMEVTTDDRQWEAISIEKHSFVAAWSPVENAVKYIISLYQGEEVVAGYDNIETQDTNYKFEGLSLNTDYVVHFSVVYADNETEDWANLEVTTPGDYGHQLNNSGFENWEKEGEEREPVEWNSFMSGEYGLLTGSARKMHMEESDDVRPGSNGKSSVRIWAIEVLDGIVANGNLTCGRIIGKGTSATSTNNYNVSLVNNPEFSEEMYGWKPDSLTVWVKYKPNKVSTTMDYTARISAAIHDTYEYREPNPSNAAENESHIVGKALVNYEANEDFSWQRISIPFDYEGRVATSADYMLLTFTTNQTPGQGSANDEVYIDDLVLIYKPTLKINADNKKEFSRGGKLRIDYTLEGTMSPTNLPGEQNTVTLELLKSGASFEADDAVIENWGTITTDYSGTFTVDIPEEFEMGDYKVRLVTTNYPMISESYDIHIGLPAPVAFDAEEVDEDSFLAVWEVTEGVDYRLTVRIYDEFLVEGYEGLLIEGLEELIEGGQALYRVENLEKDRPYTYTVQAVSGEYRSEESNKISVRTLGENPEPERVTILEGTDIDVTEFTANWRKTNPVEEYLLTVKSEGEIVEGYDGVTTTETSYKVTGLQPETSYTYFVVAKSGDYSSVPSLEMTVTTRKYMPLATVAKAATLVEAFSFVANWEADQFATDYILTVTQNDVPLEKYNEIYTSNVTEYIVSEGIEPETEYEYVVKVVSKDEESAVSNKIKVTTKPDLTSIDNNFVTTLSVYPSPAIDYLYISNVEDGTIYRITNITGSLVSTGILGGERVDISSLVTGVYLIEVGGAKAKFVKE